MDGLTYWLLGDLAAAALLLGAAWRLWRPFRP